MEPQARDEWFGSPGTLSPVDTWLTAPTVEPSDLPSPRDEWFASPDADPPPRLQPFATPTGAPCPRTIAVDGGVTATADCHGCGFCILLFEAAFGFDLTS